MKGDYSPQATKAFLIKETHTHDFLNVTGSATAEIQNGRNMAASMMWRFRRSDANLRNEWTNYSNWPYTNVLPVQPSNPPVGRRRRRSCHTSRYSIL